MSLQLLQGYSSAEEAADDSGPSSSLSSDIGTDDSDVENEQESSDTNKLNISTKKKTSRSDPTKPPPDPSFPSALDAFAEVTGPPEFLNLRAPDPEESREALGVLNRKYKDRSRRDKKNLPPGAVVEAKPQLVAIRDRVNVDFPNPALDSVTPGENKRKITAANPGPEDAANLLRMCLPCGVPKTYSHAKGMVCPLCGDRPSVEPKEAEKKKGSAVKDKEKSKRMRGQSSHATWKSETEMHLRQQFD